MESQSTQCILCKSNKLTIQFAKDEFYIVKCDNCGLVFVNPLPAEAEIVDFYNKHTQPGVKRISIYLNRKFSRERRNIRKLF